MLQPSGGAAVLRSRLGEPRLLTAPGVFDCVSARIVEDIGFEAAYVSGMGLEASRLGRPDVGLMTMNEVVSSGGSIARSVSIPVICDADTGYGGVMNVRRTIEEMGRAGLAAVHLEDQTLPKRCGGMEGRTVISERDMVAKIRAACSVPEAERPVIIARSDAKYLGQTEVVHRLNAYLDAGADLAMIAERYTPEELEETLRLVHGPTCVVAGITPWAETLLPPDSYAQMGVRLLIYPLAGLLAAAGAVRRLYGRLHAEGSLSEDSLVQAGMNVDELNQLVRLDDWIEFEASCEPRGAAAQEAGTRP